MKFLTPAFAGLLVLLVAGLLVAGYVAKSLFAQEEVVQTDPSQLVPMALATLEPGTVITEAHLGRGPVTRSRLDGLPKTTARSDRVLLGRIVKNRVEAANPIDTLDLYAPGERPPVKLAPGMRAVSVNIDGANQILGNVIRDGDYVDVHFTPSVTDERARGGFTMRLFEGVRMIDHGVTQGRGSSVALEVSPEQANILILARDRGSLQLAYTQNGPGNGTIAVANEDRAYLEEILGLRPLPEPERFVTEQISGTAYGLLRFEDDERTELRGNGFGNGNGGNSGGYNNLREPPQGSGLGGFSGASNDSRPAGRAAAASVLNRSRGEVPSQSSTSGNNRLVPTSL